MDPHNWYSEVALDKVNDPDLVFDRSRAIKYAEDHNLRVEVADDYVLQVDIDNTQAWNFFVAQYDIVRKFAPWVSDFQITTSRSGTDNNEIHRHVYISLREETPELDRILLQAVLGSDRRREFFNYLRHRAGEPRPVLLFEAPAEPAEKKAPRKRVQPNVNRPTRSLR
jgi:hypothetical protein